jgi:hypothetical protein
LVALFISKLRIVAFHESIFNVIDGKRLQEVSPIVHEIFVGSDIISQCQQLTRLLESNDPTTLHGLWHSGIYTKRNNLPRGKELLIQIPPHQHYAFVQCPHIFPCTWSY